MSFDGIIFHVVVPLPFINDASDPLIILPFLKDLASSAILTSIFISPVSLLHSSAWLLRSRSFHVYIMTDLGYPGLKIQKCPDLDFIATLTALFGFCISWPLFIVEFRFPGTGLPWLYHFSIPFYILFHSSVFVLLYM